MALKGDLASVDLAQVFQMLALNQKVGLLSIQAPKTWKALYFDPRGVTLYYNQHTITDRVLAALERSGRLLPESVKEARDHAGQTGMSVTETLLAGGFLSQEELEDGTRTQLEEEIYDLFFWKDARFEFFEGANSFAEREGVVNERFFFSTDSLIMEAARLIDEWSFIQERVPGPLEVYRLTDAGQRSADRTGTAAAMLELADGKRNVGRLIEIAGMPPFQVYKALAQLLDAGLIESVPQGEHVAAAQECVAEGRLTDAINLYEKAITLGEGIPDTHELLARAYEAIHEYELATQHLKAVAEIHAQRGDGRAAAALLKRVVTLIPTDLAARERLVALTIGDKESTADGFDPAAEGKKLVDLYLEVGEIDRVRAILERLLRDNPADLELKKSLINVHTKAGDTKRVVELYESIANDLVVARRPIEAVKYLQKVLLIDRARNDISERIRSLYEQDERSRSRRRSLVALGILFCCISLVGVLWFFYEHHARERFDRLDATREIAAKDFEAAARKYEQFQKDYPLTLVWHDAKAELAKIAGQRLAWETQLETEKKAKDEKLRRLRSAYKTEWDRFNESFHAQALDQALESIETTKKLVLEAGEDDDRKWANEVALERSSRDLRNFLGEAAALERSARERLDAGDWRGARKFLLNLLDGYEITTVAKHARLPVAVVTRPRGAAIWRDGFPLTSPASDGKEKKLETPALVLLPWNAPSTLELRLDGFEPRQVTIDPRQKDGLEVVLTAKPTAVVKFEPLGQTQVALARGLVAAGLRGGNLAIASIESGRPVVVTKLQGLTEITGTPVIALDRLYFRTNEGGLAAHSLNDGGRVWQEGLQAPFVHDPVVKDGRVIGGDDHGFLLCFDAGNGRGLWRTPLAGSVAGAPAVEARYVRIGTGSGELLVIDASDGSIVARTKLDAGVTTAVLRGEGRSFLGLSDGKLVAVDDQGGTIAWRQNLGRALRDGEICVTPEAIFAIGADETLRKFDPRTGEVSATLKLGGRRSGGPVVVGHRVFVTVREEVAKGQVRDCLRCFEIDDCELAWEFRDGSTFLGSPTTDGETLALMTAEGRALLFR